MTRRKTTWASAIAAFLAFGALIALLTPEKSEARYLRDLQATIKKADAITVTEHSDVSDYLLAHDSAEGYREKVYQIVQVTPQYQEEFAHIIGHLTPETQYLFNKCDSEPHHTITFFRNGKQVDRMDICFTCSQLEWRGSSDTPPASIYGGLAQFIQEIGLHPRADWGKKFKGMAEK